MSRTLFIAGKKNWSVVLVVLIIIMAIRLPAQNQEVLSEDAKDSVAKFLKANDQNYNVLESEIKILCFEKNDIPDAYLFKFKPKGFTVVSSKSRGSSILAYSFNNNFADIDTYEWNVAMAIIRKILDSKPHQNKTPEKAPSSRALYGPYVYTMWGQVNCYDINNQLINVSNIYTPNHYAPGCVAISQATIMHHYKWPPRGVGAHAYTDLSGSSTGYYAANYGDSEYDWSLMLDKYRNQETTLAQRQAVGDLAFDAAISIYTDFEWDGSTSNVNRIPTAYANYFRFTSLHMSESNSSFWSLLDENMMNKNPVILSVSGPAGGHSVVCDGLNTDGNDYFYHLNMGWWGITNGWYKIRGSFDAGTYNVVDGAVMNIIPEPYLLPPEIYSESSSARIHWSYPENIEIQAFELQNSINNGSWQTLSSSILDTSYTITPDINNTNSYRVRAKTNGTWYTNSWSTTVNLIVHNVSVDEYTSHFINVYPNPFSSKLHIEVDNMQEIQLLEIFDVLGEKVFSTKHAGQSIPRTINTNNWKQGLYIIRISGDNQVLCKTLTKQ